MGTLHVRRTRKRGSGPVAAAVVLSALALGACTVQSKAQQPGASPETSVRLASVVNHWPPGFSPVRRTWACDSSAQFQCLTTKIDARTAASRIAAVLGRGPEWVSPRGSKDRYLVCGELDSRPAMATVSPRVVNAVPGGQDSAGRPVLVLPIGTNPVYDGYVVTVGFLDTACSG